MRRTRRCVGAPARPTNGRVPPRQPRAAATGRWRPASASRQRRARRAGLAIGPASGAGAVRECRLQQRRAAGGAWRPSKPLPPRPPPLPAYHPGSRPRQPPEARRRPWAGRRSRSPNTTRLAPSRGRRDRSGSLPKAPGHAYSALLARLHRQGTAWQPHRRPANRSVRRPRAALQLGALPRSDDCPGHSPRTAGRGNRRSASRCFVSARCFEEANRGRLTWWLDSTCSPYVPLPPALGQRIYVCRIESLGLTAAQGRTVRSRNEYEVYSAISSKLPVSPRTITGIRTKTDGTHRVERLHNRPKTNQEDFAFVLPSADS